MFIVELVVAGSFVLLLPSMIIFFPCTILIVAWLFILIDVANLFTGAPEFLGRLFVEYIVAPVQWFFMSVLVYFWRAIEYGLIVGIAAAEGNEVGKKQETAKIIV